MKNPLKIFAVTAFIKPKDSTEKQGVITKYEGRSYKGVVSAINKNVAKEKAIKALLEAFKDSEAKITRSEITIRGCEQHNDFALQ